MKFKPPKGWESESDTLFIDANGVRIERRVYREREGWFLIPADLDQEVVYFDPTPEGRDQAFAAYAEGLLAKKSKKARPAKSTAKPKRGRKPKEAGEDAENESDEDSEETTDDKGPHEGAGGADEDS